MTGADLDNDGKVDVTEKKEYVSKLRTQQRLAIAAISALIITGLWLAVGASIERLDHIGGLLDIYWITLGGVIATYMGAEAWVTTATKKG